MSYEEMMRMLREINENRVSQKVDIPDFLKDIMNGLSKPGQNQK